MQSITTRDASRQLTELIEQTAANHQPVVITGEGGNAILLSEDDWNAIAETLYLNAIPGMADSIREAMQASDSEFSEKVEW